MDLIDFVYLMETNKNPMKTYRIIIILFLTLLTLSRFCYVVTDPMRPTFHDPLFLNRSMLIHNDTARIVQRHNTSTRLGGLKYREEGVYKPLAVRRLIYSAILEGFEVPMDTDLSQDQDGDYSNSTLLNDTSDVAGQNITETIMPEPNNATYRFLTFQDEIGQAFHRASLNYSSVSNPESEVEISLRYDHPAESSDMLQRHFFHVAKCMNLCLDIEREFKLQEHLYGTSNDGDFYLRGYDERLKTESGVHEIVSLKERLKKYIRRAERCFGKQKRGIGLVSMRIAENLKKDLVHLLKFLQINSWNTEDYNLRYYFNTYHNTLTENSAMERWQGISNN